MRRRARTMPRPAEAPVSDSPALIVSSHRYARIGAGSAPARIDLAIRAGPASSGGLYKERMFDTREAGLHAATPRRRIREAGLYKEERQLVSPQAAAIRTADGRDVLNFCANNYLGLSSHPEILAAARRALDSHGFGLSSVRFICGTQDLHKELEGTIARFFGVDDAILYGSCFDANGGLFETLLGEDDAIISDALNHASIIDGIRLCKAERHRYPNGDMAALEEALRATQSKRLRMIATDGVFSMDGYLAKLDTICDLAEKYNALVMVDDSHATGFIGPDGPRHARGVRRASTRVDVLTSTLGKALGGASGGFTAGRREIVELLRQRSRPYLFSNTLAPVIAGASIAVFGLLDRSSGAPRARAREREALPRRDHRRWLHHQAGHAPDRARHDRRRAQGGRARRRAPRRGHLRHRLQRTPSCPTAKRASARCSSRPRTSLRTSTAPSPPSPRSARPRASSDRGHS